jgi:collagenase-like PrtC family protease
MQEARPEGMQTEVFAFGRMPLAFSARCFTARNRNLPKDDCRFSCIEHPDGLLMQTREKQEFLILNGIQSQSALVYNLAAELEQMIQLGVDVARLSPQSSNMTEIIAAFDAARSGTLQPRAAAEAISPLLSSEACNGYWYGKPGLEYRMEDAA